MELQADIAAQMPAYEFHRSITLPLVLGSIGPADPMAGSDGVYYMYDDLDVDYDRVAVYDWVEDFSRPRWTRNRIGIYTKPTDFLSVPVPFNNWYFGQNFTDLFPISD
ncbi:MAG: hypothetical protein V9F00_09640 [Nocardioides sp.]